MPKIGNATPNEPFNQVISNSPGPVSAPNLPNTGSALAEGNIRNASQNAANVAQSGALGLNTISNIVNDVGSSIMAVTAAKQRHDVIKKQQAKMQDDANISANSPQLMFKLHDFRDNVQRDNLGDPDSWSQKFRDGYQNVADNFYAEKGIKPGSSVAQGLDKLTNSFAISVDDAFTKVAPEQRTANIEATTKSSLDQTVNSATNLDQLPVSLNALGKLKPALDKLQGEALASRTVDQYRTKVILNALKGEAVVNPKRALNELDNAEDNFNHFLDSDQMREVRTLADNTQRGLEKTAKDKETGLQAAEKTKIDDIKYGYTNNPSSTDMDRVHAQNKLLEYKNNSADPELRKYAAEAYDHLENKKSEQEKSALEARQTAALESTAASQQRAAEALAHKEYLGSEPVMKLRAEAETAYDTAYNLNKKLDPGTKISLLNKATDTLNKLHDKNAISDSEFIARRGALKFRLNQVNESLTPPTGGLSGLVRQTFGSNEEHYYDAISAGASPEVVKLRGHGGSEAEKLNDNSEFISRLGRYVEAHKAMWKGLPNATQLKQYIDLTNNDMKKEGPQ
jgi:hypothetical protein